MIFLAAIHNFGNSFSCINLPIGWNRMPLRNARQRYLSVQHNVTQWMLFDAHAWLYQTFRFTHNYSSGIRWYLNVTCAIEIDKVIIASLIFYHRASASRNSFSWWIYFRCLSLTCQPIDSATRVRFESICWSSIVNVQLTIRQHIVFAADVCVRIQVHARILNPSSHHNELRHIARHLRIHYHHTQKEQSNKFIGKLFTLSRLRTCFRLQTGSNSFDGATGFRRRMKKTNNQIRTWHFNTAVLPAITYSSCTWILYFWLTTENWMRRTFQAIRAIRNLKRCWIIFGDCGITIKKTYRLEP